MTYHHLRRRLSEIWQSSVRVSIHNAAMALTMGHGFITLCSIHQKH